MSNFYRISNSRQAMLLILILILIVSLFIESSQPPAEFMNIMKNFDKIMHFSAYGCLSLLICTLCLEIKPMSYIPVISAPLFVAALVGSGEEFYQMYVPGRQASIFDLLADISGAIMAILFVNMMIKISPRFRRKSSSS